MINRYVITTQPAQEPGDDPDQIRVVPPPMAPYETAELLDILPGWPVRAIWAVRSAMPNGSRDGVTGVERVERPEPPYGTGATTPTGAEWRQTDIEAQAEIETLRTQLAHMVAERAGYEAEAVGPFGAGPTEVLGGPTEVLGAAADDDEEDDGAVVFGSREE